MPKKSVAVEVDEDFNLNRKPKSKRPTMSLDDDDDDQPRLKKKKASTELVIVEPERKSKKAATDAPSNLANLRTVFGDDAEEMVELLESGDDDDSTISKLNKRLIQSSINLIAQVEKGVHESNGRYGVHSYNGLVQTIRELVIDLQSTKDRGALGVAITENILRPAFLDMAMQVMTEYAKVAHDTKEVVGDEEQYKQFRKVQLDSRERIAAFLQDQYGKIRDDMVKFLQR
jgi:hypothetical protein